MSIERLARRASSFIVRHKSALSCAKDVTAAAFEFTKKPGIAAGAKATAAIAYAVADYITRQHVGYVFSPPEWTTPFPEAFSKCLVRLLDDHKRETVAQDDRHGGEDSIVRIDGCVFGINRSSNGHETLYVRTDQKAYARSLLLSRLRERLPRSGVLRCHREQHWYLRDVWVEADGDQELRTCARTQQIVEGLLAFKRAREPRTIMLQGRPGVGKTTMARAVAHALGGRSLRIKGEDISSFREVGAKAVAELYKPTVFIVDDFDRWASAKLHLDFLTELREAAPVTILTVNQKEGFDDALVRTGRVDKIECIDVLDVGAVTALLGPRGAHLVDRVKLWPASSIHELGVRIKVLGVVVIDETITELEARMKAEAASEDKKKPDGDKKTEKAA